MSTVSPLRKRFGARLRTLILNSPHKQCDLAKALDISNSAVSQMLIGKIIPRHTQLKVICNLLALSRDEELELSSLLLNIRNGESNPRSRFNQMFAAACREQRISLEQLALQTGVSLSRLQLFENCFDAIPLLDEINRLAPVLACTPEDMVLAAGLGRTTSKSDGSLCIAEPATEYKINHSGRFLPLVELSSMKSYRKPMSIYSFAAQKATRQTCRGDNLPVPAVAITASARKLQLGISGEVILLVSDQLPPGYRDWELFSDKDNNFRIRERKSGTWKLFQLPGDGNAKSIGNYAVWSLYILELIFCPIPSGMVK